MNKLLKSFMKSEDGAITVDWVLITAAGAGLALGVMAIVGGGSEQLADDMAAEMATKPLALFE